MRTGFALAHGQRCVEEQHTLIDPPREVTVFRGRNTHVVAQFGVNVGETSRQRANVAVRRKREPHRVPGRRVGVLAYDDDSNGLNRNAKCAEDVAAAWCVSYASGAFRLELMVDVVDCVRRATECGEPTGVDTREEVRVHDLVVIRAVNGFGKADDLEERVFAAFGRQHGNPRIDGNHVVGRRGLPTADPNDSERDVAAFVC